MRLALSDTSSFEGMFYTKIFANTNTLRSTQLAAVQTKPTRTDEGVFSID